MGKAAPFATPGFPPIVWFTFMVGLFSFTVAVPALYPKAVVLDFKGNFSLRSVLVVAGLSQAPLYGL
jgi:hypothetical protein